MIDSSKVYRAKNMLVKKLEKPAEDKNGFLSVSVFSEDDREPVSDAKVTISLYEVRGIYEESATAHKITSQITDENGKVPIIELPVIHELGNPAENTDEYHMRVEAPGYYTVVVMNIEIFKGTTTAFNVVLTPVITGETYTEYIIIPEKH